MPGFHLDFLLSGNHIKAAQRLLKFPPADPVESSAKTYFAGIYEQAIEILPNQFAAKCFRGWLNTRIILKKGNLILTLKLGSILRLTND